MLLALLQLPQDPRLALTLPDELLESEPDSHCRRRSGHLRLALFKHESEDTKMINNFVTSGCFTVTTYALLSKMCLHLYV